jgi:hypothetical protein
MLREPHLNPKAGVNATVDGAFGWFFFAGCAKWVQSLRQDSASKNGTLPRRH